MSTHAATIESHMDMLEKGISSASGLIGLTCNWQAYAQVRTRQSGEGDLIDLSQLFISFDSLHN